MKSLAKETFSGQQFVAITNLVPIQIGEETAWDSKQGLLTPATISTSKLVT
jgi:hypothetical protein